MGHAFTPYGLVPTVALTKNLTDLYHLFASKASSGHWGMGPLDQNCWSPCYHVAYLCTRHTCPSPRHLSSPLVMHVTPPSHTVTPFFSSFTHSPHFSPPLLPLCAHRFPWITHFHPHCSFFTTLLSKSAKLPQCTQNHSAALRRACNQPGKKLFLLNHPLQLNFITSHLSRGDTKRSAMAWRKQLCICPWT